MNSDSSPCPPALITGGDHQGLAALRCLARHGVSVYVCDHEHSIARYSRYCRGFFRAPPPADIERYARFLAELGDRPELRGAVLIPDSDEQVYAITRYRDELAKRFIVSVPPWSVIEKVYIKQQTYAVAEQSGIPAPKTWVVSSATEAQKLPLSFPVILKPSIRDHYYRKTKTKALKASNAETLVSLFKTMEQVIPASEILIQEFIPGGAARLYSAGVFFRNGRIHAGIVGRRARQHPMDFGHATTYAEPANIPLLLERAERFLSTIGYYGIAEVEFLQDARDDEFKLIEVNPRIWGWHLLAIANGLELPWYAYQDLIGHTPDHPQRVSTPIKWVRMVTDLPTALQEWMAGRLRCHDWWASLSPPRTWSVWTKDDPLPCLMETVLLPYLYWKRGF